jgi:aminoglycoside 3-N-acetyltransferase I
MDTIEIRRFSRDDVAEARQLFALLAQVFDEQARPLSDVYVDRLLARPEFWAVAAFIDGDLVGGLTAHVLPMTRAEFLELFIYDIAVRADRQRQGIGRRLMGAFREMAAAQGIHDLFVSADADDPDALEFYRALGATGSPVSLFVFSPNGGSR